MQYDLFKTRVWKSNSGNMFSSLEKTVLSLMDNDSGRSVSNISGWQSSINLADKDEFKQLKKHILTMVTEPLVQFGIDTLNIQISINDLWANVNPKQAFNVAHDHLGEHNFLSFCYYIKVNSINGSIGFKSEAPGSKFINLPKTQDTELNSTDVSIKVTNGDLLVFPSWIEHYTLPNPTDDLRISIAGNVKVKEK